MSAAHAFTPPPELVAADIADPAVMALLASFQNRIDMLQLRLAGVEGKVAALDDAATINAAAPVDLVPFERRLFPWIGRLAQAVADEWGVSAAELTGLRRTANLITPRFVLDWAVKQAAPDYSLPQIGRLLNRDHTTVIYSCRRVNERRTGDEVFRHVTDQLAQIGERLRAEHRLSLRARADEVVAANLDGARCDGGREFPRRAEGGAE